MKVALALLALCGFAGLARAIMGNLDGAFVEMAATVDGHRRLLQAGAAGTTAWPAWSNGTKIKVCTSEFTPMVYCADRDQDAYSGYEIELFRKVARIMGWAPDMLEWSCLEWEEMLVHLRTNDGVCDIAVGGVEVKPPMLADGITFTRPTYQNGLTILVKNSQQTAGLWSFWDAFEWQLWIITLATCLASALVVWAIDNFYWRYSVERFAKAGSDGDALKVPTEAETEADEALARQYKFERYWWEVISRAMMNRDLTAFTTAGNVIQTVFGFLMLILFTLYLGNTAANLTILNLSTGGITGLESLPGLAVGTWTDYAAKLRRFGIAAKTYPWDSVADEEAMVEALKSGAIKALVLDSSLMNYLAATDCEVSVVGEPFDQFSAATAFPANFTAIDVLRQYNEALVALEDSGEDEQLLSTYVTPPESECGELYSAAVTLEQVAGLWILLGISIAVAVVWLLIVKLWENAAARRAAARAGRDSSTSSPKVAVEQHSQLDEAK